MLREFARHHPSAFEVGVDDVIPVLFGVLQYRFGDDDAGVVDEDGQRPEGVFGNSHSGSDAVGPGDVAGDRQALPAGCFYLTGRFGEAVDATRSKRHFGSSSGEKLGEVATDPARGPRDQRNLICQVEARQCGHEPISSWPISFARWRNSNFWILPVEVFGSGPKTIVRGTL